MKSKFLILLMFFLGTSIVMAQDAEKIAKDAQKALTKYYMNNNEMPKLIEAKNLIDKAFQAGASSADAYEAKGEIYAQLGNNDELMLQLKKEPAKFPEAGIIAYDAYKKSYEAQTKDKDKKKILEKMGEVISTLNNAGSVAITDQVFDKAYANFDRILNTIDMMQAAGVKSPVQNDEDLNNIIYITALSAMNSDNNARARELYKRAYDKGFKSAVIYDGLYRANIKDDPEAAAKYLAEGRAAFPDDNNLLFSQINLSLSEGKLDALISDLQLAMEKEPENVSVINTLGNVYDKLYQGAIEKNDTLTAVGYYDNAIKHYEMALKKDPNNSFALYSLGTIFYNKAAAYIKDMNSLGDDMSSAGLKKYNFFQSKTNEMFDRALPYFIKSEQVDPKDKNTLIALKEIYARKNELEKSKEYKTKIEQLGGE